MGLILTEVRIHPRLSFSFNDPRLILIGCFPPMTSDSQGRSDSHIDLYVDARSPTQTPPDPPDRPRHPRRIAHRCRGRQHRRRPQPQGLKGLLLSPLRLTSFFFPVLPALIVRVET